MCGEKLRQEDLAAQIQGSPPRVRGKAVDQKQDDRRTGITPACAGKRAGLFQPAPLDEDHPRVCGEKDYTPSLQHGFSGSPPRVRGKVILIVSAIIGNGITPACAGKSGLRRGELCALRDHPRVCGEKTENML